MTVRELILTTALCMACGPAAFAQQADGPSLKQLDLRADGGGYAVVMDDEGHEYHCEAKETRDSVDLGTGNPLRLVTPLDTQLPAMPPMNPAKRSVVDLFERNRCSMNYVDLKAAIELLDARQRKAVARTVAEMTERGEIADDELRERAILRIGDRCA